VTDARAIGVFDSGVGGLTVLRALRKALPHENFIYLGDTARLPYGTKSAFSVQRYAVQAASYLSQHNIKLLILACNTVTADALNTLHESFPNLPIIGVINPGAIAAIQASTKKRIGVISTRATKKSGAYQRAIQQHAPEAEVFTYAAPLLVPLAEEGWLGGDLVTGIVQQYLQPVLTHDIDCLVLGCTHYPAFLELFQQLVNKNIQLVDSAQTTATATVEHLRSTHTLNTASQPGNVQFYSTDDPHQFAQTGSLFLGETIALQTVILVDL
jgi:glutamate racemase